MWQTCSKWRRKQMSRCQIIQVHNPYHHIRTPVFLVWTGEATEGFHLQSERKENGELWVLRRSLWLQYGEGLAGYKGDDRTRGAERLQKPEKGWCDADRDLEKLEKYLGISRLWWWVGCGQWRPVRELRFEERLLHSGLLRWLDGGVVHWD